MRNFLCAAFLTFTLLSSDDVIAQTPPLNPDMPITFASTVPDVCFGMVYQNTISPETRSILDQLPKAPAEINGMYPRVPTWYRLKKESRSIFIGVGDKPNLCHIVLTNSKDGRQSFSAVSTLLRSVGFKGAWDARGTAVLILARKTASGNMLVLLKGLTDATDGIGPQVSVDVGSATDEQLRLMLGGK